MLDSHLRCVAQSRMFGQTATLVTSDSHTCYTGQLCLSHQIGTLVASDSRMCYIRQPHMLHCTATRISCWHQPHSSMSPYIPMCPVDNYTPLCVLFVAIRVVSNFVSLCANYRSLCEIFCFPVHLDISMYVWRIGH